jgi:hypothetical protein
MPVIKYDQAIVYASQGSSEFIFPASNISISAQSSLQAGRILAPNQNDNFRIAGPSVSKISLTFLASKGEVGYGYSTIFYVFGEAVEGTAYNTYDSNFAQLIFNQLTGFDKLTVLKFGKNVFSGCYLDSASIQISNFAPVTVSAEFTCLNAPTGLPIIPDTVGKIIASNHGDIAYGFNTQITNGTLLSDSNRDTITYKVDCNRTYSTAIGQINPNNIFLDSVEKEINIKSTNIGNYIDYRSYGDAINIDPKNASGQSIISGGFGMSSNSRIMSQNLSIAEGGILAGDISLREIVL